MVKYAVKNDFLYGIGRAIGRTAYMPLVSKNGKTFDVIDKAGYYQKASTEGRRSLGDIIKTYKREKYGKEM